MKHARRILATLCSLRLTVVLLGLLLLLTWLGTLHQVDHGLIAAKRKYFDSYVLLQTAGPFAIPLPGGLLVMGLLFCHLIIGGMLRLRWDSERAGVLIGHVGIAALLLSGFVQRFFAYEGYIKLHEGERSAHITSYLDWELVLSEATAEGRVREFRIPQERFAAARSKNAMTFAHERLPFHLRVHHAMPHAIPQQARGEIPLPVRDGWYLHPLPRAKQTESEVPGAYIDVQPLDDSQPASGLVWGEERHGFTAQVADREWVITLRRQRRPLPFAMELEDFTAEFYPGTRKPRSFESVVMVHDDGAEERHRIVMNEPLRRDGHVVYQESWGPQDAAPGTPLFSRFAVMRNPADRWPIICCAIIAVGMSFHFGRKLLRYIRSEARKRDATAGDGEPA